MAGYAINSRFVPYINMKIKTLKFLFAVILPLIVGQSFVSCKHGNPVVSASLDRIEQVVQQRPDSALIELVHLDSLLDVGAVSIEGDRQMARYALLKTQTHDKNWIDDTNDSLILRAVRYYDEHGSKREQMLAHFYHGAIFRNAKDYGAAFFAYRQAEQLAMDLDDDHCLCLIYGNLFTLSNATYSKDAIRYAQLNLEYARKSNDTREACLAQADLARAYSNHLVHDSAELYFRQVLDSLPSADPIVQYCLTSFIEECVVSERFSLADSLLELLNPIRQPVDLMNKACLFQIKGISDSVDIYMLQAKQRIESAEEKVFYYEKASWIAEMNGDLDAALAYKRKRITAQNEVVTSNYAKSVSDYQRDFEIQQKEYVSYRYVQYRRWTLLAAICVLAGLSFLFSQLKRLYKARSKELDEAIKRNVEQGILLGNKEDTLDELRTQIERMEYALQDARSKTMADRLSRLLSKHFNLYNRLGYVLFKTQGMLGQQKTIFRIVEQEIKRLYSDRKCTSEIDQLLDETYDGIMTKAKSDELNLSEDDIRLVRYMLLQLSSRTIAYLFDIDPEIIYKRKYRLKENLKNSDSSYANSILEKLIYKEDIVLEKEE